MRRVTLGLVLLMIATLPLESAYAVPGGASLSKLVGVLAAVAWVLAVAGSDRLREPHAAHLVALLFVLWNACSLLWTVDVAATEVRVLTYVQLFVLMLVLWDTVTSPLALLRVLVAYLVGCSVAAGALVVDYVTNPNSALVHGRATVGTFNPNDAGIILALALPIAIFFLEASPFEGRGGAWFRLAAAGYLPLGAFAVAETGSRAAVAAAVVALCYGGYLLARRSGWHLFVGAGAVCLAGVVAAPFLPHGALFRLLATGREVSQGNLNERQQVWPEALRLIHEHPLVGVGGGAFRTAAVAVNKVGHNFVLALLAELGPVGLALFCALLVMAVRCAQRSAPRLRALWLTLFTAWMVAALLHNWEYRKLTWVLLALMIASASLPGGQEEPSTTTEGVGALPHAPDVQVPGPPLDRGMAASPPPGR